jgi:hypothetical protein
MKVLVPENTSVVVKTVSAEVRISDVRGAVEVRSTRGAVTVQGPIDQADVETLWGDITMIGPVTQADLTSLEGDVHATDLQGSASLRAWNGDMVCTGTAIDQLDVYTSTGSARLAIGLAEAGMLQAVVNGTGDIQIEVPETTRGLFTFVGGARSTLPEMSDFEPTSPVNWILGKPEPERDESAGETHGITTTREFSIGEGDVRVIVQCDEIPANDQEIDGSRHRIVLRTVPSRDRGEE